METRNYTLGRGKVYLAPFQADGATPGAERYFGNTPDLSWAAEIEDLDHFNSDQGINEKDDNVTLQVNRSGTVVTDNIAMENLALFWFGTSSTVTVAAATGLTWTASAVTEGEYQLGTSASDPTGLKNVSNVSAVLDPGGAATALNNTDFTVDQAKGRVSLIAGGDAGLALDGTGTVQFTFDVAAQSIPRVISGTEAVEGALRFVAYNPKGKDIDYFIPWVRITPDGDYSLKGDDWQQMSLNIEILKKSNLAAVYADGEPTLLP